MCICKGKEGEEAETASHSVAEAVQVGMCDADGLFGLDAELEGGSE